MPSFTKPRAARRPVVGLDIEPSFLAAAEVGASGALIVERAAAAPLEPGLMRDGEVTDVEALGDALKAFFRTNGLGKRVRLGVANQRIVVRTLDAPPLTDRKQLEAAVRFQAAELIPMPLDQAVLDFQVLGPVETAEGPRLRVMVVAARRSMIERLVAAARRAGLRPEGIDLAAFALIRALDRTQPEEDSGAVLYVHVGGLTNLAVAHRGICLFTRVMAGGYEGMVTQLAERRALTLEHARQWLDHVGLIAPLDQVEGDAEIVREARAALDDGVRRIADEVRNSLDFYRMQEGSPVVDHAVLTGLVTGIAGFREQLARELGIEVEAGLVDAARPDALRGVDPSRLAVAVGLAVEERPS